MNFYHSKLAEKLEEALKAVLPIIAIVLMLCFTIAPIPSGILLLFLFGAVLLVIGMMFFTLGSELSMTPMGEKVGTRIAKSFNLKLVILLSFILGFIITISEPDLQVLAEQVPSIPNQVLIFSVAGGVGVFLAIAILRMLFSKTLAPILVLCYILVFFLAFMVPDEFLAVAFDSGGVTTGPMTATFLLPFAIGACQTIGGNIVQDAFGIVSMVAMTPLITIHILGVIYKIRSKSVGIDILVPASYLDTWADDDIIEL